MKYYIITVEDAVALNLTDYRRGSSEKGYVVTSGDLVTASQSIKDRAKEVTLSEAKAFIKAL